MASSHNEEGRSAEERRDEEKMASETIECNVESDGGTERALTRAQQ